MIRRLALLGSLGLLALGTMVRAGTLELVMVEQVGCHWCAAWHSEIGPAYPNTVEGQTAPLRMVNLKDLPDDLELKSRPRFTPTFVLVSDGVEVARLEGYPGEDFFWPMLERMLDAAPSPEAKEEPQ